MRRDYSSSLICKPSTVNNQQLKYLRLFHEELIITVHHHTGEAKELETVPVRYCRGLP